MPDPTSPEDATLPPLRAADPSTAMTLAPDVQPSASGSTAGPPGYEILGELGRGGMGVVYKAKQTALDRVVALKMILSGVHAGESERQRFRAEAEAVARLTDPGIVAIHEVGEHEGNPFFSLEFCPGGSLEKRLTGTPWPGTQAAELIRQLALAIAAAHRASVVHRDLKPANVLFTQDGSPKITDFGLAKRLGEQSQTQTGSVMGTPSYMAPEQAEGKKDVGPGADLYALGAILYELLTGRPPFRAETALDTIMQVVADEPTSPRQLNPKTPRDLETIVLKCLQKDPRKRYATANDLAADLASFLVGEPIRARPVGVIERGSKWARRRPALASSLGAVALMAILAFGLVSWQWLRADAASRREAARAVAEEVARQEADRERREAQRLAITTLIERGVSLCEQGEEARGILTLVRALELAEPREPELSERARRLIGGWSRRIPRLTGVLHRWAEEMTSGKKQDSWTLVMLTPNDQWANRSELPVVQSLHGGKRLLAQASGAPCVLIDPATDRVVWGKPKPDALAVLALASDGRTALLGAPNSLKELAHLGEATLWDLETDRALSKPLAVDGKAALLSRALFAPDGKALLTWGKEVRLWDVPSGMPRAALPITGKLLRTAFSRDGSRLMTVVPGELGREAGEVRLWDVSNGKRLLSAEVPGHAVEDAALSPDGARLLTVLIDQTKRTRDLRLWDVRTGKATPLADHGFAAVKAEGPEDKKNKDVERQLQLEARGGNPVPPEHAILFSPDGETLATAVPENVMRLWDAKTGRLLAGPLPAIPSLLAFSEDGKALLACEPIYVQGEGTLSRYRLRVVEPNNQGWLRGPPLELDWISKEMRLSPDGSTVFACDDGEYRFWDVRTGRPLGPVITSEVVVGLGFEAQSRTVIVMRDGDALWLHELPRREPAMLEESVLGVAEGGEYLLTYQNDTMQVRRRQGGPIGKPFPLSENEIRIGLDPSQSNGLAVTADGRYVVVNALELRVGEVSTGRWRDPIDSQALALTYDPASQRLAVLHQRRDKGRPEYILGLWDLPSGKRVEADRKTDVRYDRLAFRAGRPFLSTTDSKWGQSVEVIFSPEGAGEGRHVPLADSHAFSGTYGIFAADWKVAALRSERGRALRLWSLEDGKSLGWERAFARPVMPVLFTPDGKTLICKSDPTDLLLIDVATGLSLTAPIAIPGDAGNFTVADEGRTLLFRGGLHRLYSVALPAAVEGDPERVRLWAETIIGMESKGGSLRNLEPQEWHARRERLRQRER